MEKNNRTVRYIAGACFVICVLLIIIGLVSDVQDGYSLTVWNFLGMAANILIAIAMFSSTSILITVGAGILTISCVQTIIVYFEYDVPVIFTISAFIELIAYILIAVASLNKKSGKILCIVAGTLGILELLVTAIGNQLNDGIFEQNFRIVLCSVVFIIGIIMIGLAMDNNSPKLSNVTAVNSVESQIERLTKLKSLLDRGIISQDEFEAKKKQILGQ